MLSQLTRFRCHTLFSSQDVKQNVLLNSYLDVINFKIYLLSSSNTMADWKKIGNNRNTEI